LQIHLFLDFMFIITNPNITDPFILRFDVFITDPNITDPFILIFDVYYYLS